MYNINAPIVLDLVAYKVVLDLTPAEKRILIISTIHYHAYMAASSVHNTNTIAFMIHFVCRSSGECEKECKYDLG